MFFSRLTIFIFVILHLKIINSIENPSFIHQVMIVAKHVDEVDNYCGGALIHFSWAVSSSRCVQRLFKKFEKVEVIAGFNANEIKYQEITAVKYEKHQNFDIVLVKVEYKFTESNELKLAKLPKQGEQICNQPITVNIYPKVIPKDSDLNITKLGTMRFARIIDMPQPTWPFDIKSRMLPGIHATILGESIKVGKIQMWFRKKSEFDKNEKSFNNESLLTGVVSKRPPELCNGNRGWPLYCGNKIFGIETDCTPSHVKDTENIVNYVGIDSSWEFLAKARSLENTDDIRKNRKSSLHGKHNWIEVLMIVQIFFSFFQVFKSCFTNF